MTTTMTNGIEIAPAIRHAGRQVDAAYVRERLQGYIEQGRQKATTVVKNIMSVVPQDRIVAAKAMDFEVGEGGVLRYKTPGHGIDETLHRNALGQMAGRLEIPMAYVDHLQGIVTEQGARAEWAQNLLARTLREHTTHSGDRWLVRSVGGEARAVLSDKFRRIDCRPSALALIEVAQDRGLIVSDGIFTETRTSLKFILPQIVEPVPGEHMVFGFDWSNSDFGRGANDLRMFMFRLLCWNGAVGESVVRQVHIGRRLEDDVAYSEKTVQLDAAATASALRDHAAHAISEVRVQQMVEGIRAAHEQKLNPKAAVESLRKALPKGDVEKVVEAFNSPDVENMPGGQSLWRWSNALSFVAGNTEDADKRIDLERLAGDVLKNVMPKAAPPAAGA